MTLLLAIAVLLLCFYLLAVLTEEFFVPSIDVIAKKLGLSHDAAGATLLAIGSSAPEFFIALIAVLGLAGGDHADIGAGAVVGSAIFNVLVIIGISTLFKTIHLDWKNAVRDLGYYLMTIIALFAAFLDGKIVMYEAVLFVVMFFVYIILVINWKNWVQPKHFDIVNELPGPARNFVHKATHKFMSWIIPDPAEKMKHYRLTFGLSIVGIAGISWILVQQIITAADVLSINATFLSLTVLAAGTSIPDLIGSVVVARQGRGDMAVSNALGSNVFDILFALGLPWIISLLINNEPVVVGTENFASSIALLFASVVAITFLLISQKFKIGRKSGLVLVALYFGYCAYVALSVI